VFKPNLLDEKIAKEITRLLRDMELSDRESDEYTKMVDNLSTLYELNHKSRFSKEQLATIAANLLGIVLVIKSEHVGVITSKAFSLVKKII
jgi:hypothetical protein